MDISKIDGVRRNPLWAEAIVRSYARNLCTAAQKKTILAIAALGLSPEYFNADFKTLGFLFECLCIRDLKAYSSPARGSISYYRDRYGLAARQCGNG